MSTPHRDPWVDVKTINGLPADEVISTLQKSIRRGMLENTLLIAYEMAMTSVEMEEYLWSRLVVIAVEDVGIADVSLPVLVETLYRQHMRYPYGAGDRFLFAAHAVRVLCASRKDRGSDEMTNWVKAMFQSGRLPEIPDFAIDMHTKRGQALGRDDVHFLMEAAHVENELPDRDRSFRDRLLEMKQASRQSPSS